MKFARKQRVILISVLYVCAAALVICGVCLTVFPRSRLHAVVEEASHFDEESALLSSSEIWTAGARSLTSTSEESEDSEAAVEENDLQSTLPQLYHVPEVFALNYAEMTNNLRVYIYPNSPTNTSFEYDVSGETPHMGSTAARFFNLIARSAFRTANPDEAHLFLLPVSIDKLSDAPSVDVGHHLRHYINSIRTAFPFWDRSLGADHFYLASRAFETGSHRNNLELSKNAVQVACSPLPPGQPFFPHKDIVLPEYHPSSSSSSDKFCVSHSMRGVVDALRSGCVPVMVSDSTIIDLPFQDVLKWREFSVVIGTEEVAGVEERLAAMADGEVARMRYLGGQASKHMEWSDATAVEFDAFHLALFELWMRRHSVKYSRRSES